VFLSLSTLFPFSLGLLARHCGMVVETGIAIHTCWPESTPLGQFSCFWGEHILLFLIYHKIHKPNIYHTVTQNFISNNFVFSEKSSPPQNKQEEMFVKHQCPPPPNIVQN
jgi:hypothetical protein